MQNYLSSQPLSYFQLIHMLLFRFSSELLKKIESALQGTATETICMSQFAGTSLQIIFQIYVR